MSQRSNRRTFQGRRQPQNRSSPPKRRGIQSNLPPTNLRQSVNQSQNRLRQIKSPFARDQTRTISNRPNPNKKRKLGQIPLRDRSKTVKVTKVTKPKKKVGSQFIKKNKTKKEIEQVFSFDANERSFF